MAANPQLDEALERGAAEAMAEVERARGGTFSLYEKHAFRLGFLAGARAGVEYARKIAEGERG